MTRGSVVQALAMLARNRSLRHTMVTSTSSASQKVPVRSIRDQICNQGEAGR